MAGDLRARALLPAFLLAVFLIVTLASLADEAPTTDEVDHLAAGYTYLRTGDFRFGRDHPPLMKMLAAAPLLFLDLESVAGSPGWKTENRPQFNAAFFLHNRSAPRRMLFLARLPMIGIGVLMGLVVFLWARELWGDWPGVFVLFLYAFCPNILAHTRLVTTDAGIACFTLLTLFALWCFVRTDRLIFAAACGVSLGCALLAKYSAVVTAVLVAILLPLPVWSAAARRRFSAEHLGAPPGESTLAPTKAGASSRTPHWSRMVLAGGVIAVLVAVTITVGYGSPRGLGYYYEGLQAVRSRFRPGKRPKWAFLWGEHSRSGFWDYYLLAQLWKTPVPTLVFFVSSLVVIARDRSCWFDACFVLLPIAAFHAAGMLSEVNIGIRHLLPAFPFVFLACGAAAWKLSNIWQWTSRTWHRVAYGVFAVLCAWNLFGTLRTFPHFISYFNELVGGPDNGIYYLDDSNIDWGQDMFRLRRYIEDRHPANIRVASFAPLALRDYGIDAGPIGLRDLVLPQPGVTYFVSADYLQRRSLQRKTAIRFEWLQRYRPVDKVGWSIFVYRFSTEPAAAADSRVFFIPRAQWYADAIVSLRAILAQSPQLDEARRQLAEIETDQARWLREREKGAGR